MVARLGVGASAASAVIFSVLLVSSLVVFAASQNRAKLYLQSDAADSLSDRAAALMGAGGTNVLLEAQTLLGSGILGCPTAQEALDAALGRLSDTQRTDGLTVSVSVGPAGDAAAGDNLSLLAPFNGSLPGDVDVRLKMVASGRDSAAGVTLSKTELHLAHLPVRLGSLAGDCVSAFEAISRAISASPAPNCTAGAVAPLMDEASRGPASVAAKDGFGFGLACSVMAGATCTVEFQVSVLQSGVQGPGGPFAVRVQEGGSATFGQRPPPPSG